MLAFFSLIGLVFLIIIAWFMTSRRRLKRRGEDAIKDVRHADLTLAETIVFANNSLQAWLEDDEAKRAILWQSIGGFQGIVDLHHDAACRLETMEAVLKRKGYTAKIDDDVKAAYYSLGILILVSGFMMFITKTVNTVVRYPLTIPSIHLEYAIRLSAVIASRTDTVLDLPTKAI
ncbi:hypothetical protein [Terriglobus albidus]|uniref:hypothetical protein n=1 Tax=Terriglobus albidus TaxID=1592106 RepID=UPI0021DFAAE5|nr:hypothetical protein [Terriglobus albidus]